MLKTKSRELKSVEEGFFSKLEKREDPPENFRRTMAVKFQMEDLERSLKKDDDFYLKESLNGEEGFALHRNEALKVEGGALVAIYKDATDYASIKKRW